MTTELHVLSFIAPLLKPNIVPMAFQYHCQFKLEKNALNQSKYADIVSVLTAHTISIQDETEYWIFYLDNINLALYTDEFIYGMTQGDAATAFEEILNASNYNKWQLPHVSRNLFNLVTFVENCIALLNLEFVSISISESSCCLCPSDNTYHSYGIQYYMPASIAAYDYIRTNCGYPYGLSTPMRSLVDDYYKHLDNNVPWDKTFCYQLGTQAVAPEKNTFDTAGFTLYAIELTNTNGNILTYKTNVTLIPPMATDSKYYFEFYSTNQLVDAEHSLLSPSIVYNANEIIFKVHKINAGAAALTLPFPIAKFVVRRTLMYISSEVSSPDIEIGPSN